MKTFLKYFTLTILVLALAFFVASFIVEYRPETIEPVTEYFGNDNANDSCEVILPSHLKIMSWNIGYAGLGDNMDFCVDGGEKVRDSKERTQKNLENIIRHLKEQNADIYLIQEVDIKSHRTYLVNELEAISKAFPGYYFYFAPNFKVWFVPSPLKEPIGPVHSGLLLLTKFKPDAVRRVQYPSSFSWPVCMFNLKRCLLEADFKSSTGKTIHIGNTHNTAFDTGGMRTVENEFLKSRIAQQNHMGEGFIIGGDWNQCPMQYKPTKDEIENRYFAPEIFDTVGIGSIAQIRCDTLRRSMRYNDKPYDPQSSTKSVLDFFLLSKDGVQVHDMHIIDLDFHSSDHNPVVMELDLI